jgi:hypothetical protein
MTGELLGFFNACREMREGNGVCRAEWDPGTLMIMKERDVKRDTHLPRVVYARRLPGGMDWYLYHPTHEDIRAEDYFVIGPVSDPPPL